MLVFRVCSSSGTLSSALEISSEIAPLVEQSKLGTEHNVAAYEKPTSLAPAVTSRASIGRHRLRAGFFKSLGNGAGGTGTLASGGQRRRAAAATCGIQAWPLGSGFSPS